MKCKLDRCDWSGWVTQCSWVQCLATLSMDELVANLTRSNHSVPLSPEVEDNSTIRSEAVHQAQHHHPIVEAESWSEHGALFVACIFVILAAVVKILYHRCRFIANFIPESCVFILFGCVLDPLLRIMLESAYSLNQKHFYVSLVPILLYAVVGTVINIATIGPSLYAVVQLDSGKWLGIPSLSLLELMIFGASISAIDPVAVLALFKDLKVKKSLYYLVFGESLLNDAVVLVIHRILYDSLKQKEPFSGGILTIGLVKFSIVSFGSLAIGLAYGALTSLLTLTTRHVQDVEPILLIVLAYTAYISAEIFEWSGVVSIVGCGLFQAEFAFKNISHRSRVTIEHYIKALSSTADIVIFIFLGMILVHTQHHWNVAFLFFTTLFCLLYRMLSVISLTGVVNYVLKPEVYIQLSEQLLMVHAGLRGAIAYVLIAMLSEEVEDIDASKIVFFETHSPLLGAHLITNLTTMQSSGVETSHGVAHSPVRHHLTSHPLVPLDTYQLLQTTTMFIILLTVFLMGSTTKPLLNYLQIEREPSATTTESLFSQLNRQMLDDMHHSAWAIALGRHRLPLLYRASKWLKSKYLRRVFLRKSAMDKADGDEEEEEKEEEDESDDDGEHGGHGKNSKQTVTEYQWIVRRHVAKQLKAKARRVMKPVAGGRVGTRFDPIMLHFHQHSSQIILNGRKLTASGGVAPLTTAQRIKRVWMSARDSICLTMSSEATRHRQVRQLTTPDKVMVHAIEPKLARVKVIPGPGVGGNPSYPATLFTGSYHRSARINPTPTVFHIDNEASQWRMYRGLSSGSNTTSWSRGSASRFLSSRNERHFPNQPLYRQSQRRSALYGGVTTNTTTTTITVNGHHRVRPAASRLVTQSNLTEQRSFWEGQTHHTSPH